MENDNNNEFYFDLKNYFQRFVPSEENFNIIDDNDKLKPTVNSISRSIRHALEYFVSDLRRNRDKTIERFLKEQTVDDIFRSIAQLLLHNDDRICGNSAYILGSTVELEDGLKRFLIVFSNVEISKTIDVIQILCYLLKHSDTECVLNAAGTLGTICSSKDGRDLILHHANISQIILNTSALLSSNNLWIASNVALILARITVDELGCQKILTHSNHCDILNRLLLALNISDTNRSTNAAFAIGRLIEEDNGKKRFVSDCGQYSLFDALLQMLEVNDDKSVVKNACYTLSCLCTSHYGFQLCLQYLTVFHRILQAIEKALLFSEHESVWFALMCLRTIAQYDGANEHLFYSKTLTDNLKQIRNKWIRNKDIQNETKLLWYMLHRDTKPDRPIIDELRNNSVGISWKLNADSWDDNDLKFRIILNNVPVDVTNRTNYCLKDLKGNTDYNVQIQYVTSHGDSLPSNRTPFRTDDELPPPVNNLHVERRTMTAARIAWEPPDLSECKSFKGYQVYLNNVEYECTTACTSTINSLSASTIYQIDVCVMSNKGNGPRVTISVMTAAPGDSFPAPPTFSMIGRREIHIKWQPPEVISGRFTHYKLLCNKQCIYAGTDQEYHLIRLKPDTEYTMEVIVITNEGKFRSRPVKVRTSKDEYNNSCRYSLYEPPTQSPLTLKRTKTYYSLTNAGLNDISSKKSSTVEHRLTRESTLPNRNIEISTVHPLTIKSSNSSSNRSLPGLVKGVQYRSTETTKTRTLQRSKTEGISVNQRQSQTQIAASVIVPSLGIDSEPQTSWATPVSRKTTQPTSFRLSLGPRILPVITNAKNLERSAFKSLPELPLNNLTRTRSYIQS